MKEGKLGRNLVVAFLAFLFLPIYILLIPLAHSRAIGNWLSDSRFNGLPGLSRGGRIGGILGCCYAFFGFVLVTGLIGAGSGTGDVSSDPAVDNATSAETTSDVNKLESTASEQQSDSSSTNAEATDTSTVTPESTQTTISTTTTRDTTETATTSSPTSTPTSTPTQTPTPTSTPTPTQTPTSTPEPTPDPTDQQREAAVVDVVDGDTIKVRYENGSRDTVRLLGVDTPEVHAENTPEEFEGVPNNEAGADCLSQHGDTASSFAKDELMGETVTLEFDENEPRRGYYDRLLAYVIVNGTEFNHELVENGHGRVYDSQFVKQDSYYESEAAAQDSKRGLWECTDISTSTPTPEPDSEGEGDLEVADIVADASGNDHENENGEYIVFKNSGDSELSLDGWSVRDEADHVYHFPSGFSIGPGDEVTLYTGSGTDSESELYWGSGSAIWNNGGDTVFVTDDSGDVVVERSYS